MHNDNHNIILHCKLGHDREERDGPDNCGRRPTGLYRQGPILKIGVNMDVTTTLFPKVATNGVIHVVEDIILTEDSLSVMQVRLTLQYHYIFVR